MSPRIRRTARSTHPFAFILACVAGMPLAAWAQPVGNPDGNAQPANAPAAQPVTQPQGQPPAQPSAETLAFLARQIERVALMDLRTPATPQPVDYGVAALLCELAARHAPQDVELARRRAEACWNWGDQAQMEAATKRIVQLDNLDTLAQLRLISSRFASMQTAEQKVAAFDRVGENKDLDASIRSRFLLDAALLVREQGDDHGFVKRLVQSIELDSSNKDAAYLALSFFEQRSEDRWGRLDLIANLLLADPLDPQVHVRLIREFASGGAYEPARRFMSNLTRLLAMGGQSPTAEGHIERTILDMLCDGPDQTYAALNEQLVRARKNLADQLKVLEEARQPTASLPKPDDIRLDMDRETIRILGSLMMGDAAATAVAVKELGLTAHDNVQKLKDPLQRPPEMDDATALEYARIAVARVELWRLVTGVDLELVEADLPAATQDAPEGDIEVCAIRAMVAARAGNLDQVPGILDAALSADPWLDIARGMAAEKGGDVPGAIASFRAAQTAGPLTPHGALAGVLADRLHTAHVLPADPARAELRAKLETFARGIDRWVDEMTRDASSFEYLAAKLETPEADAIAPAFAQIELKNVSGRPMGIGAGRPINSRLLIAQSLEVGGRALTNLASAEVIDAGRRLRLMPGESVVIRYALDDGPSGWLLETTSGSSGRIRLRVVQGFEILSSGARVPGPACLEVMSQSLQRRPLLEARLKPEELAGLIARSPEDALPKLLVAARAQVVLPPPGGAQPVVDALVARYPGLSPAMRCLVVAALPPAVEIAELKALDDAIASEASPEVLGLAVVTRAATPESPLIARAKACGDALVAQIATLHESRLKEGVNHYSTMGTGLVEPLRAVINPAKKAPAGGDPAAMPPATPVPTPASTPPR